MEELLIKRLLSYFTKGINTIPVTILCVVTALYVGRNDWLKLVTTWPYLALSIGATLITAALWRAESNGVKLAELCDGYQDIQTALHTQASSLSKVLDLIVSMVDTTQSSTIAVTQLSNHIRSRPTPTQLQVILEAHTTLFVTQNVATILAQYQVDTNDPHGTTPIRFNGTLPADVTRSMAERVIDGHVRQVVQKSQDMARGTLSSDFATRMFAAGPEERTQLVLNLLNTEGSLHTRVTTAVVVSTKLASYLYDTAKACILQPSIDLPLDEEL